MDGGDDGGTEGGECRKGTVPDVKLTERGEKQKNGRKKRGKLEEVLAKEKKIRRRESQKYGRK